jgi:hypothetical protein
MNSEHPQPSGREEPNTVLRGGPLNGRATHVHPGWPPITVQSGDQTCHYRPSGEMDTEYPTLAVYVFDHAETA